MTSSIGDRIRILRKSNKLNQIQFANLIGVSQGTLSELEQDKYKPSLDTIIAIKKKFGSNINWLIFGEENETDISLFNITLKGQELKLLSVFRGLTQNDKDEILEFMNLKSSRY
ncbi:MAG: helix-turn-helix transcriptional regulator [Paenibacillaceae bacterium]